jgi:hypothetical protein
MRAEGSIRLNSGSVVRTITASAAAILLGRPCPTRTKVRRSRALLVSSRPPPARTP